MDTPKRSSKNTPRASKNGLHDSIRGSVSADGAAATPNSKSGSRRAKQHHEGGWDDDALPNDQTSELAGTPLTRSSSRHTADAAHQHQQQAGSEQTPSRTRRKQQVADHNLQQEDEQQDVIMLDATDSEDDGFATDNSSSDGELDSSEEDEEQEDDADQRPTAAAQPAGSKEAIVISDSEMSEQPSASAHEEDVDGPAAQQAATNSSSDDEDEAGSSSSGSGSGSESESDIEPFQSTRRSSRQRTPSQKATAAAASASKRAAANPTSAATPTPNRRGRPPKAAAAAPAAAPAATPRRTQAAAAAAVTPKRSTRKAAEPAAPAATPRSTRKSAPAAVAAAATPSGRPQRSCTKQPKQAAEQPSLATPMAKLSLSAKKQQAAAQPSTGKRLRSSSTPGHQRKQAGAGSSSSSGPAVGDVLAEVHVDGEVLVPGDDVYLRLDDFEYEEDDDEACEVCGSSRSKRGNPMLECSTCLRGFHLRCLSPPLKSVPEGDWLCPDCNAGRQPPPPARLITRWQKLLYGKNQLVLVRVLGCLRGKAPDGTEEDQLLVRYYILPQETHIGRQRHHGARELFLGTKTFVEPAAAVAGHAYVHSSSTFGEASEEEGNDVFMCDYEYDEDWKRFRKCRHGGSSGTGHHDDDLLLPAAAAAAADRGLSGLAGAWGARRGAIGEEFEFDDSGKAGDSDDDSYNGGSGSESDEDGNYRPEYGQHFRGVGAGAVKRKRHGQLPAAVMAAAAAADRFAGLGAADVEQRGEQRDAFGQLHASLSLAAVPASLPCRDDERTRLKGFVNRSLHEDGGILYICGVPGTGKTALVMEVLASLREDARKAGSQFVALNCLQLPSPQHVFSRLWEKLSGQHLGPARARDALMQMFGVAGSGASAGRRRFSTIIVLDEIDMLITRDQAVLYQLFDWPSQPGSRLAVIGISNTHDLDQRVLPRIASRLDSAKLAFAPYSVQQLLAIVGGRLEDSGAGGAVEEAAMQLACRKVASETGDVRRALELLRRAVEIARQEHLHNKLAAGPPSSQQQQVDWQEGMPALVRRTHVTTAQHEMFSALHHRLLKSRSTWEKLLLVAVVVEARATGRNAVVIQAVAERAANSICSLVGLTAPPLGVLQACLVKLAGVRLLLSDGCHIKAHVALNVDKDDVALAIREDERLQRLHQLL